MKKDFRNMSNEELNKLLVNVVDIMELNEETRLLAGTLGRINCDVNAKIALLEEIFETLNK